LKKEDGTTKQLINQLIMDIKQSHKINILLFSVFTGLLLGWFVYAGSTGWYLFNGNDKKQAWSNSGPGYHK